MPYSTQYSMPYGAFELKAKYQRNMMISNLSVSSMVLIVLLTFWIIHLLQPEPVVIDVDDGRTIITPGKIPEQRSFRVEKKGIAPSVEELRGNIPTPVPDEDIADGEEILLYTQEELAVINSGNDIGDEELLGATIDLTTYIEDPSPDTFIAVEIPAEMVTYVKPEYPRLCRQAGIEGEVVVLVLVTIEGIVKEARIGKSSGNESLDNAALKASNENRFRPAIQNGIPIAVWANYTVKFRLQ